MPELVPSWVGSIKRIHVKHSHPHPHKGNHMTDVLINLIVVIISQCIHMSNHCIVNFKYIQFCQLYLNEAGKMI